MDKEQKELKRVENILGDIRRNTKPVWYRGLLNGLLYGVGIVTGTVLAIVLLSWVLSFLNIIPGFGELVERLNEALRSTY